MPHSAIQKIETLANQYRVDDGRHFRLKDLDPEDTADLQSKEKATELLTSGVQRLSEMQEKLYAQDRWALLLIFQAPDAAGKDGTIKHVMSGINPQGCQVTSFKTPSSTELGHDFLWRTTVALPERGRIGIFNRSYYEEVLVIRVHPELLQNQRIPDSLVTKRIWDERFEDINGFEKHLSRNGVVIRKFFLHVSRKEQKARFLKRLREPQKNWKFSASDLRERNYWEDYMRAYEEMIRNTTTSHAPWYAVPADNKWVTRIIVASIVIETLQSLNLHFPEVTPDQKKQIDHARESLSSEAEQ